MSRGVSDKITYKPYSQSEQWLLPPSLNELVPENHFVRIVSKTVDELKIEKVFAKYTNPQCRSGQSDEFDDEEDFQVSTCTGIFW